MKKVKKIFRFLILGGALIAFVLFATDYWVTTKTKKQLYNSTAEIPHQKIGLLLGTAKYVANGKINLYYKYRIDAAVALFQSGKIDFVLISGDNSVKHYNEPETMMQDLIARGIPKHKIYLDYAGFRTLDSVLRCKEVFGENNITVISQPFHNQRAVYIANRKGLNAIAFNAKGVTTKYGYKTMLREKFARVKMMLDLTFGKKAKFYGDKIEIR